MLLLESWQDASASAGCTVVLKVDDWKRSVSPSKRCLCSVLNAESKTCDADDSLLLFRLGDATGMVPHTALKQGSPELKLAGAISDDIALCCDTW